VLHETKNRFVSPHQKNQCRSLLSNTHPPPPPTTTGHRRPPPPPSSKAERPPSYRRAAQAEELHELVGVTVDQQREGLLGGQAHGAEEGGLVVVARVVVGERDAQLDLVEPIAVDDKPYNKTSSALLFCP
jgi:hypothetical protein